MVASTSLTAEQLQSLKTLQECPIALQSIYQMQSKKFEGKIPMKKRKPTQTTTKALQQPLTQTLQLLTPTIYPSSLSKLPATTAIQILSQPNDRKAIIVPPKMEVTIEPKAFPIQQTTTILPPPAIVKIEKVESHGDEEEEVTHFDIAPINISSINSSLQFTSLIQASPIKFCNSSSSLGVDHKPSALASLLQQSSGEEEVVTAVAAASSSSSLQTTTTTTNTTQSPGKT